MAAVDVRAELAKNGKLLEHNLEAKFHSAKAMADSGEKMVDDRETVTDDGLGRLVAGAGMLVADVEDRLSSHHCMAAAAESVSETGRTSRMGAEKRPQQHGEVATGEVWYGIEMRADVRGQVLGNDSSSISQRPLLGQKHQMWTDARGQA